MGLLLAWNLCVLTLSLFYLLLTSHSIRRIHTNKSRTQLYTMTSPAGTLGLRGLGPMLEQAIEEAVESAVEKAVEKAVAKAMANYHERAIKVPPEPPAPLSNRDTTLVPEGSTLATVQHNQPAGLEKRLPTETWEQIFLFLYPSQLSRVSMVCRTFYDIVSKLSVWSEIYATVHPNKQNHVIGGFKPVPGKNPNKDFMIYVCAESLQICELCLSVYKEADVPKDRLAFFPLPVHVWRVRLASKKTGNFQPLSVEIGPQDWVVRLCLGCRRKVFEECPESESETTFTRTAYGLLTDCNLVSREVGPGPRHDATTILSVARMKYGGDIGVQVGRAGSSSNAVKSMESRLKEICLRLTRAAVDG
ncbi:MAG: hypothetical protein J3Q66DRAFT_363050 [Benniella sp.]|nr:MAG: hypothetical protein J3Q66DRAFT_363050 [Benniella sp.]